MADVRYFDFDNSNLSKTDREVLQLLIQAGEVIHTIWQKQVDQETGWLNVYPVGVTRDEILEAAKDNPEILSGTTVVKRKGDGFITVDYIDEYQEDLTKYRSLLISAAETTDDSDLKEYIRKSIEACKAGDYEKALIAYLENPNTRIEFMSGPIETYEDELLGRKKTFQYNLRVLKDDATEEILQMVNVMKDIKILQPDSSTGSKIESDKIKVRIDDVIMFSGRQSGLLVSSTNLPNQPALVEKYGTKIVVYTTSMNMKFDIKHVPLLKSVKGMGLNKKVAEMKMAMFRLVALHEIAEGTVKFNSMETRLASHYDFIRELNADLVGIDSAKYQVLNGIITPKQYQYLLASMVIFAIDTCNTYQKEGSLLEYSKGFAVMFNSLFESGAIKLLDGKIEFDFMKMSTSIDHLADLTLNILEKGTEKDAARLLAKYGSFAVFDRLPK